jgi:hypothetical protein
MYSRYFAHGRESGYTHPMIRLAGNSIGKAAGTDYAPSNNGGDTAIGASTVHGELGVEHRGQLPVSTPANVSPAKETSSIPPEERVSVLQTSSLDSVDRALFLDVPGVTYPRSRIRRRPMRWCESNTAPENMSFDQYGLDPTDNHREVLRPLLRGHCDSEPADAGNDPLEDPIVVGFTQDSALSLRGGDYFGGLGGDSGDQAMLNECHPAIISDSPEFASDVAYIPPNASYECRDGTAFVVGEEDTDYERDIEAVENVSGFDSVSIPSADWSAFPECEVDTANIHLWSDRAWPRGEAVGGNGLQEGCSHLTTVQRVEQDVARKLKGHWFPQKF